jgi:tRNA(fMet)-specific endonuclease VapC
VAYLIATNIAIHARDGVDRVLEKIATHRGSVRISVISVLELQRGIYKNPALTAVRRSRLETLLRAVSVLPFDTAAADAYGQIIAECGWVRGRDFDRMIAAHAIRSRSILVTDNVADFRDVPGLTIENWMSER